MVSWSDLNIGFDFTDSIETNLNVYPYDDFYFSRTISFSAPPLSRHPSSPK